MHPPLFSQFFPQRAQHRVRDRRKLPAMNGAYAGSRGGEPVFALPVVSAKVQGGMLSTGVGVGRLSAV